MNNYIKVVYTRFGQNQSAVKVYNYSPDKEKGKQTAIEILVEEDNIARNTARALAEVLDCELIEI